MLHRDLKPANILLAEATPKITDFGSVAVLGQGEKFAQASKHSALYVPPEGWESPSRYTFASDLYQVGIVLYELANGPLVYEADHWLTDRVLRTIAKTGKPFSELDPFEQSRLVDLSIAERAGKQTLLAHGRAGQPYFSAKIKRVVRSATHPDLARRYGSAEEFLFQITTIDVPNWRPSSAIPFEAQSWHGWDWRLQFKHKKSGAEVLVERSRPGTQKWRKFPNKVFVDILDAFTFIEAL
jgi:serine/threonine protein kinase